MTPAVKQLQQAGVDYRLHRYRHDRVSESWGMEAAQKLGLPPKQVFKTLMVQSESGELAVAIVAVSSQLDLKILARHCGFRKAQMADAAQAERASGYKLGGISALGQKRRLPTVIDESACQFDTIFISAGRRGLEIEMDPRQLAGLIHARFANIARIG